MRKRFYLPFAVLALCLLSSMDGFPLAGDDIHLYPSAIGQGEVGLLSIQNKGEAKPRVIWRGTNIAILSNPQNELWTGFIGADLTTRPGRYKLQISLNNNVYVKSINVFSEDHGIRSFMVPKEMEALDPLTLKRVHEEASQMRELFSVSDERPLWRGRWIRPVAGRIVGPFGCKTIINGLQRSPHSGVDLKAAKGTLIKASNRGRVVLVANHFFGGLSIVIDHGGGIQSMYFHLSQVSVQVGQMVEKGDPIGLAGSSGRATGPHLHFGIRLNGERVDPLHLIELSARLGQ